MKSQENKNLIKEIAKIKIYNEWFSNCSSEKKFLLSEASRIPISWVDDIGKKLRNVVKGLENVHLEKVLDDLKQFRERPDNVESLRRTFSSLKDAQLTAAVKSLISQNIAPVNEFVTEVVSRKLGLSNFEDFKNIFQDILNNNPDRKLQENIDEFLEISEIDKLDIEFQDAVRNYLTKVFREPPKQMLSKSQIKSLANAVNRKGGRTFVRDVFSAMFTETQSLLKDIENLSEEFLNQVLKTEGKEGQQQLQEAYALAISRKLNQLHMKGDEVGKAEFRKLSLPEELNSLIQSGDQDIFKIFRQLRNADPSIKTAFKSLPEEFKFLDFGGEGSEWLTKKFGGTIGKISKIRLGNNLKSYLVTGQWSTLQDIYMKAIQMQGLKDPKKVTGYLFVLLLKSGMGALIGNVIFSVVSATAYTTGLKDLINTASEKLGYPKPFDTEKYKKTDAPPPTDFIVAILQEFFEGVKDLKWVAPLWSTLAKAPLNVIAGRLILQKPNLIAGPDEWMDWLIKSILKQFGGTETELQEIEKNAKKIEKDEFVIPEDLKLTLSGDLQFLQDRVYMLDNDGFAIAFQKGKESEKDVRLVNPKGVWEVVHFTDSSKTDSTSSPLTDTDIRKYLINYFKPPVTESTRKNKILEQLIIPPKEKEETAGEKLDKKVEELERNVESIKDSKTLSIVREKWNNLWKEVKDSAADAQTQLQVLLLKQKIDAEARKVTPAGQTMNFVDCTGWNTLGCKSESIKKVQNCMDIGVSGNFDEFLKSELARYKSTYAFREGFNDSDVQKICAYKQEENRQEALKREQLAKQAQKAAEIQAFERKYPQVFPPATERDEF